MIIISIILLIIVFVLAIIFPVYYSKNGWTVKEQNFYEQGYAVGLICGILATIAIQILT